MASSKKEKGQLSYLQLPLPSGQRDATETRVNWSGLNRAQGIDTGELSLEENISTTEAPYLTPSPKRREISALGKAAVPSPIGLWGFGGFLLLLYGDGGRVWAVKLRGENAGEPEQLPSEITVKKTTFKNDYVDDFSTVRSVVAMNLYEGGAIDGSYTKKLLLFPEKISMDFEGDTLAPAIIPDAIMPNIRYATVHLSRLYGVAAPSKDKEPDRICVSGYNNYANWDVDTDADFSEAHAWISAAQSNIKATGAFTGITTYLNSVVAFKKDYMHEVIGSSNPFRINDVFSEGAVDNRTVVEVDGTLFFVSEDAVKVYTGGNPRVMSYKLGLGRFYNPVAGTDGRKYYLYAEDADGEKHLFVYDTLVMQWAEEKITERVISFAKNEVGLYMLTKDFGGGGHLYRVDTGDYLGQSWRAETDLTLGRTVDIKHIRKVQLLCDIAPGSSLRASLILGEGSRDERGEVIFERTNSSEREIRTAIRVVPRQTAHWGAKLRLSGEGFCRVYQAEISLKGGGELFTTLEQEW